MKDVINRVSLHCAGALNRIILSLTLCIGVTLTQRPAAAQISDLITNETIAKLSPAALRETLGIAESPGVYQSASNNFSDPGWFAFWASNGLTAASVTNGSLDAPRYYVRVNTTNVTDENYTNFDNVQRVMRIMPRENFEALFINSTNLSTPINITDLSGTNYYTNSLRTIVWHGANTNGTTQAYAGQIYNYDNFLKAVALLPGFCGNYSNYPTTDTNLYNSLTSRADLIARKMLATFFAHAIQETSNSGQGTNYTTNRFLDKIPGTFANVCEAGGNVELPDESGVFAPGGKFYNLTLTGWHLDKTSRVVDTNWDARGVDLARIAHGYFGRGSKQLSNPANYANFSAIVFGDLRAAAWPELLETSEGQLSVSAYLSGIVYGLIPKVSKPSLAEVMDGQLAYKLKALAKEHPEIATNPKFLEFCTNYDHEFPTTIWLVNGAVEGGKSLKKPENAVNWQTRVDAYNWLISTTNLLNQVYVGTNLAVVPPVGTSNEFYDLTGSSTNFDTYTNNWYATNWVSDAFVPSYNAPNEPWRSLFVRDIYYSPEEEKPVPYDAGLQIFGGSEIKEVLDLK